MKRNKERKIKNKCEKKGTIMKKSNKDRIKSKTHKIKNEVSKKRNLINKQEKKI